MTLLMKRVYDAPAPQDGHRVLVDGIWPRGISRARAAIDRWAPELAPSAGLRSWYGHRPERFDEFSRRYRAELRPRQRELSEIRRRSRSGVVTLVFAARDVDHSNAAVLADVLRRGLPRGERRDEPSGGPQLAPPSRPQDDQVVRPLPLLVEDDRGGRAGPHPLAGQAPRA
jgi:uncharacterized protein YeaO (DUF488 family)